MTDLQTHVMALVDEIDAACADMGIPYALYGRTAGCAEKHGRFRTAVYAFHIMMPGSQLPRLRKKLNELGQAERAWEDRTLNSSLSVDIARYVDTGTTLFDRKEAVPYRCSGVAVTIHPVHEGRPPVSAGETQEKRLSLLQRFRAFREKPCYLETETGSTAVFHTNPLNSLRRISFEGRQLPVPTDLPAFLQCLYGPSWKSIGEKEYQSANSSFVIWDASLPYTAYLEEFKSLSVDMSALFEQIRELDRFTETEYTQKKNAALHYWELAQQSVQRVADAHSSASDAETPTGC